MTTTAAAIILTAAAVRYRQAQSTETQMHSIEVLQKLLQSSRQCRRVWVISSLRSDRSQRERQKEANTNTRTAANLLAHTPHTTTSVVITSAAAASSLPKSSIRYRTHRERYSRWLTISPSGPRSTTSIGNKPTQHKSVRPSAMSTEQLRGNDNNSNCCRRKDCGCSVPRCFVDGAV